MIKTLLKFKRGIALAAAMITIFSAGATAMPASAAALTCRDQTWRQGESDACVGHIQSMLNYIGGYYRYPNRAYLTIDNDFGALTKTQVKAYQSANFLTADGVVGSNTWSKLCNSANDVFPHLSPVSGSILEDETRAAGCYWSPGV